MARRRRSAVGPAAWCWLVFVAAVYGGLVVALPGAGIVVPVDVSGAAAHAAAAAVYLAVAFLLGFRSVGRAVGGAVTMLAAHLALVAAAAAVHVRLEAADVPAALSRAVTPPATLLQLVAVLVMLLPFRRLLARPPRYARATPRAARPVYPRPKPVSATPVPPAPADEGLAAPVSVELPAPAPPPAPAPEPDLPEVVERPALATPAVVAPAVPVNGGARRSAERAEEMVRVPFARIAEQLPADAFLLPMDRVAANLLEPGYLLVPVRLLLPQLAEGMAEVPWRIIADQFPRQALARPDDDLGQRLPGAALALPIDEIIPQLPPDLFAPSEPGVDVRGLEDFPPPFQPHVPPPGEEPGDDLEPDVDAERPDADVAAMEAGPEQVEEEPAAADEAEAETAATVDAAPHEPPVAVALPEPLMRALHVERVQCDGIVITALLAPSLDLDAVVATALRLAPFLADRRLAAPAEQVTFRNGDVSVVVTPERPRALLVTASDTPASLAFLERWALHVAGGHGASPVLVAPDPAGGERLRAIDVPDPVEAVAGMLRAFGPVAPAVVRDEGTGTVLYLFRPPASAALPLASFARDVHAELANAELGAPVSLTFRLGPRRLVIQTLESGAGRTTLLVAGGPVDRPGLARVELERAARRLAGV